MRLADHRRLPVQRRGRWSLGSPTGTCTYLSGRLREPARAEPPPPTRSTTKQPPFSESSTSLEPPLTRDWRGDREPDPDRAQRHQRLTLDQRERFKPVTRAAQGTWRGAW